LTLEQKPYYELPAPNFAKGLQVQAYRYVADTSDVIDVQVESCLQKLSEEGKQTLMLSRLCPGEYEIDARRIRVYAADDDASKLLVHESGVAGSCMTDLPLQQYLNLVAHVAVSLKKYGAAPTFCVTTPTLKDARDEDRCRAMNIACVQAEMRESSQQLSRGV